MRGLLPVVGALVLAGCIHVEPAPAAPDEAPAAAGNPEPAGTPAPLPVVVPTPTGEPVVCAHPYPCGDDWPPGLSGPFELLSVENVTVESFDGTTLAGVLWRPAVPEGVRVPVVIEATPYAGQVNPPAWDPAYLDGHDDAGGYVFHDLLENGYAVAIFSVRGTGSSAGCFDFWGEREQRDNVALVEWAAAEPWSNGRVAMYGLSYKGTTPWQAAVRAPPALKTIVVSGILTDLYLAGFTPQGAAWAAAGAYAVGLGSAIGTAPPARGGVDALSGWATRLPSETCPDTTAKLAEHQRSALVDERDAAWYEERRLAGRLGNVTAAVLATAGYEDGSAHLYQDDTVWAALTAAPKHMVFGHWGHRFPTDDVNGSASGDDFRAYQLVWLDYWLKGLGDVPAGTGAVDYETAGGAWRVSPSWPPAEARSEVLHLAAGALAPAAGSEVARRFAGAREALSSDALLCATLAGAPAEALPGLVYVSAPVAAPTEIAGNAMAYVRLASSEAGGLVSVALYRMPDLAWCTDAEGEPRLLTIASADLRFYAGGYTGTAFPVGTPTAVRLDFWNVGARLEAGERLAIVVHRADRLYHDGQPRWMPQLSVHEGGAEGSQLVLPVVAGTLGGAPPTMAYPPRPFEAGTPTAG